METFTGHQVTAAVRSDIERITTITKCAKAIGIAPNTLTRYLNRGNLPIDILIAIGDQLGTNPSDYLTPTCSNRAAA